MTHSPNWQKLPTPQLLEEAYKLIRNDDSPTARCISALVWRLKGSEEWIAVLQERRSCEAR